MIVIVSSEHMYLEVFIKHTKCSNLLRTKWKSQNPKEIEINTT